MTRTVVYSSVLVAVVAASAMTLASVLTPGWVSYSVRTASGRLMYRHDGLHRSCSNQYPYPGCRDFPDDRLDCAADVGGTDGTTHHFCAMWRSTGFLMSLAAVVELAAVAALLLVMAGGRLKREAGWRIVAGLLAAVAVAQFCAMAIVAYLFDHEKEYLVPDWHLGTSYIMCTTSAAVAVLSGLGLAASAYLLPPEGGYEFLGV